MKQSILIAAALTCLAAGAAHAQNDKPMMKPDAGPTEKTSGDAGIARDPGEVKAQQGNMSKSSPGTVGAAPGADTKSQGK